MSVITSLKKAADTSDLAMREVIKMLGAVGSSMKANSTASVISNEVLKASKEAFIAASGAVNAVLDEEGEINEETMKNALNLSAKANTDVEAAVKAVDEAVKTQKKAKVIEYAVTVSKSSKFNNSNIQTAVHVARSTKNAAQQMTKAAMVTSQTAAEKWEMIYDKMKSMTQGGRRKHTRRKRCRRTHRKRHHRRRTHRK